MATDEQIGCLAPNALLILSVIGARNGPGSTSSPKSDEIGAAVRQTAAWVHRHGKGLEAAGLATLSPNGHCFLSADGMSLARRLRADPEVRPEPEGCRCGSAKAGPCVNGRQLYECGRVLQWCPDRVPGLPRAEVSPRSEHAQHRGVWFAATPCPQALIRRYGDLPDTHATADGTVLLAGLPVVASHGSGARHRFGAAEGTVIAAASGTALVSWPATVQGPAAEAEIMPGRHLVLAGALDFTGLSSYQDAVVDAIRRGAAELRQDADGTWSGTAEGRTVNAKTLAILSQRGLLAAEPPPPAPAPGMR